MFIHNRLGMLESVETMLAQEQRLHQVTNNLANVDTTGYKKETVTFGEMLYQVSRNRQRVGKALAINTIHQQGALQQTENPFDLAISGDGFFQIQTPDGVRYTRAGNFQRDNTGRMVTANGSPLLGQNGPIIANGQNLDISRDGRVTVDGTLVDRLAIVTADPQALHKEGENLFRLEQGAAEEVPENFVLHQGFLEKSNVNTILEMTEMIDLYRAYEGQQKMIRAMDDLDDLAARRVGALAG
jgi:flagellar basal-body rod protein FlgG